MNDAQTIMGLPISNPLPVGEDYSVSPYSAIAVIKGIDSDGDDVYAVIMTDGMTPTEGAGLLHFAVLYVDERLRETFASAGSPAQE